MDWIMHPWPWYVAGPLIAVVMFLMLFFGKKFGVSSNLRTVCAASGAGKYAEFFRFEWKKDVWNLIFILGAIVGGFVASEWLTADSSIALAPATVDELKQLGISNPGAEFLPSELYGPEALLSFKGILFLAVGGILVGFGTRYAGGCTSGHGISGLSNLQLPSLIAVIGFFIGGLTMTYLILPYILPLLS